MTIEGEILEQLTGINQKLQRVVELGESPEALLAIPPDPEMLGNAAFMKGAWGRFSIPTWRTALACPLAATTILTLNIPEGWVAYRRRPIDISSDLYDPNIGINIYSDDILINPAAPMPLTASFTVDMGEYVTQWTRLVLEVINGTALNAVVSFHVCTYLLDKSLWDEFVSPLIDLIRTKYEDILRKHVSRTRS